MNIFITKIFWIAMIDVFLSGVDLVEIAHTGCLEDFYEDVIEDYEDPNNFYIKKVIAK